MASLALPAGAASQVVMPDLVADRPENPRLAVEATSNRLLLRFDSFVHNAGAGPLHILGTVPPGGDYASSVAQRIDGQAQDTPLDKAEMIFEDANAEANADGHNHFHLQKAARYSLWTPGAHGAQVAPAAKVGFCLLDSLRVSGSVARRFTGAVECKRPAEGQTTVSMGVSAGWRDLYAANLAWQWVDVSSVAPGSYELRSEVDPDGVVVESDEANAPSAGTPVRVPGHLARTVVGPTAVELRTERVEPMTGALAPARFRILTAPRHGTIDKPVGAWFTDPVVRYLPANPAAPVADELEYVALAGDSDFPRDPPRAKAVFGQGSPVTIEGAPERMVAGTSVQLRASADGPVRWSATAGTVGSDGLFTAPATPGAATVRARTEAGSTAAVEIAVQAPPVAEPAPVPAGPAVGDPALVPPQPLAPRPPVALPRRTFVSARAQRIGRFVAVSVVPGRTGTLRFVLRRGKRTVDSCRVRATAGRSYTCRLRPPRRGRGKLRVVVQLRSGRAKAISRTVAVRSGHVH